MAPRRSSYSDDSSDAGPIENTMEMNYPDFLPGMTSAYQACAGLSGAMTVLLFILFIWTIVIRYKWGRRHSPELRFLTMTTWAALFAAVLWALICTSYMGMLLHARVPYSWYLMTGFQSTFSAVAEFLLLASVYCIMHNRLRAVVGVQSQKLVAVYARSHWLVLGMLVVLSLVMQAGDWGGSATSLSDAMDPDLYQESTWIKFLESAFVRLHVRRTMAAFYVLRLVVQLEMIAVGIVILTKMKNGRNVSMSLMVYCPSIRNKFTNYHLPQAMTVFFIGSLVTYIISPLSIMSVLFHYWDPSAFYDPPPPWLYPLNIALQGFPFVICVLCICIFAAMTSRVQWQLGASRSDDVKQVHPAPGMVYAGQQEEDSNRYLNPEAQGHEQYSLGAQEQGHYPSQMVQGQYR